MNLYPLKFKPVIKEKIWGGDLLNQYLDKSSQGNDIGEIWTISGYEDNETIVANGYLADNSLNELVEVYMGELVGDKVYECFGNQFPLLIKLIGASEKLSIQVHPDDDYAREQGFDNGKNEFWYITDSHNGNIVCGLNNQDVSKDEIRDAILNNTLPELLNMVNVEKDDYTLISAGTVHSLGKGVCVVEIQQTSDITYRMFDYGRVDANGNPRELHIEHALNVINAGQNDKVRHCSPRQTSGVENLCHTPYFTINHLKTDRPIGRDYAKLDSFVIYIALEGQIQVQTEEGTVEIKQGESVLIPCSLNDVLVIPKNGSCRLLEVYIDQTLTEKN